MLLTLPHQQHRRHAALLQAMAWRAAVAAAAGCCSVELHAVRLLPLLRLLRLLQQLLLLHL
jgi:hypothetical protein